MGGKQVGWWGSALTLSAALIVAETHAAHAMQFNLNPDWVIDFDNSIQYTLGVRVQPRDQAIANNPYFAEGDYKFDEGNVVTNRPQDLVEFQAIYKGNYGVRASGSLWNDFAYNGEVKTNPNPAFSTFLSYPNGHYSSETYRYNVRGSELLDAFAFANINIGSVPVYIKAGRLAQQWGNAFFFGFSDIAYGQAPLDYNKAFTQPGSEIKELLLPRTQLALSADLTPELSIAAEYFFEYRHNRFPEGGTYLGPFDILYGGPTSGGYLGTLFGGPVTGGRENRPESNNGNYGFKVTWSPQWAGGDIGLYFRQLDDPQPWSLLDVYKGGGGLLHMSYAQHEKLIGASFERSFGLVSTGYEVSFRKNTALNSALTNGIAGVPTTSGATGDIVNGIANALITLNKTRFYDTGSLIAEVSYTHLTAVTGNAGLYNGVGHAACVTNNKWDGCATNNAVGFAILFDPQWLQVRTGLDIDMPLSYTYGIYGNPAYAAGSFYAQGTNIYSIGIKATYRDRYSLELQYNGYKWVTGATTNDPRLGKYYAGFGGNGAVGLNDKGWLQLTAKVSF